MSYLSQNIINALDEMIFILDSKYLVVDANEKACALLRTDVKTLKKQNILAIFADKKIPLPIPDVISNKFVLENPVSVSSFIKINGENILVTWKLTPYITDDLKLAYFLVGSKKNAASFHNYQQLRVYLHNILLYLPCYVYWKDVNSVYIGCNDLFAKAAGLSSSEEIVGKTDYDLAWGQTEAELFRGGDKEVLAGHFKLNFEEPQLQADGTTKIVLASKVPMRDEENNIIGVLGIYSDITERKTALEREKKAIADKVKAEQEQAELEAERMQTLAATIAHELRTPLGAIGGVASWLKLIANKVSDTSLKKKLLEAYTLIAGEISKTNAFITITLESLTELKNKKLEKISIKDCVMEAIERFPYEYDEKKLIHSNQVKDFTLIGDRETLIHVLFNLIKNALYFIEAAEKGEVAIWTDADNDFNYLHFEDTGKGMPQHKADRIFDKFYTDTGVGTGIGLYFCKNAMKIMGGDIECKAKEDEFAHFILSFPKTVAQ